MFNAGSVAKSVQLQAEFAEKAAAAGKAHAKGQIWNPDAGKGAGKGAGKTGKKQQVQNPAGTGRKFYGPDGVVLTGKKRKAAFQMAAKDYSKQKAAAGKWHPKLHD